MSYSDKSVVVYGCKISDNDYSKAFEGRNDPEVGNIAVIFSGDSRVMVKPEVLGLVVSTSSSDDASYEPFGPIIDTIHTIKKIRDEADRRGLTLVSPAAYYCIPCVE